MELGTNRLSLEWFHLLAPKHQDGNGTEEWKQNRELRLNGDS